MCWISHLIFQNFPCDCWLVVYESATHKCASYAMKRLHGMIRGERSHILVELQLWNFCDAHVDHQSNKLKHSLRRHPTLKVHRDEQARISRECGHVRICMRLHRWFQSPQLIKNKRKESRADRKFLVPASLCNALIVDQVHAEYPKRQKCNLPCWWQLVIVIGCWNPKV